MVKDVEEFRSKAQSDVLSNVKLPLQSKICLESIETAQHIATKITLLACRSRSKSCLIEDLATWKLIAKELKGNSRIQVRSRSEGNTRSKRSCTNNINRRRRSRQDETID